ncbi:site-specific integrase [Elizabethkingia anophelis]|uniref:site-specific integrase n=1 Tax=Elizabethkingia anophelis TaxID=1117645 RepID=UPI000DD88ABC|nr:site-specific integrase [Elizabethkingia anophelis]MCT3693398.1 site-specific integrase [Elizabethkingia anophelis]MCT3824866.1 site-specific integrase [Elizabethkingia anophelis]MCT3932162.1 site-specific integrase [Elizabethkingia anophelis]MCT4078421.1 site-specific integrase [Elizabethkingia anophelis]MCT4080207.1 site-specific integrase [Elizabethkingia anophelis]
MSNTNIKIVLGNKPLSNSKYLLYLRITKNRRKKEISLGIQTQFESFINEQLTKNHPNYKIENELLFKLKQKALEILRGFQLDDKDFSLDDFEHKFRGIGEYNENFIDFFDEIIQEMETSNRIGNAKAYREAKNTLLHYLKSIKKSKENLKFKDITPAFLEKFEVYMRSRSNCDSGIAFRMRQIRAVFNKAISRKMISQDLYPFKFYKISRLKLTPNKRALTIEEFKRIRDLDLTPYPNLIEAYNYFMFSFYTRGMNFVDMMLLKKENIQNGRIIYTRSKTKGKFNIEIVDKAQDILEYYKAKSPNSSFIFPILLQENLTPQQIAYREQKVLARYNKKLKQLAKLAGIDKVLTSYVARHSFATILKQIGTSTDIISELMGHSDVQVTMTYLKEFDNKELDNANRKLLKL